MATTDAICRLFGRRAFPPPANLFLFDQQFVVQRDTTQPEGTSWSTRSPRLRSPAARPPVSKDATKAVAGNSIIVASEPS